MDRDTFECFLQKIYENIYVSMVTIEREQFGDYGKIIIPKFGTQPFTWHKTESKKGGVGAT